MIKIPTDSLHKFSAISGIVIILFFVSLLFKQMLAIENAQVEINKQGQLLENIQFDLERQSGIVEMWQTASEDIHTKDFIKDYEAEVDKQGNLTKVMRDIFLEFDAELEYQKIRLDWLKRYKILSSVGIVAAIVLTIFGFYEWIKETKKRKKKK